MLVDGDFTSWAESFHSLCNKYAPKSDYVQFEEWIRRKKLARLHWNDNIKNQRDRAMPVPPFQLKLMKLMKSIVNKNK